MTPLVALFVLLHPRPILAAIQSQDPVALLPQSIDEADKKTIRSQSGEYELTVTPTKPHGLGPTDYVMAKNGEKVWSGTKPFFLLDVAVSNKGTAIGTSYNNGRHESLSETGGPSMLSIWFLDQTGEPTEADGWPRHSWAIDGGLMPVARNPLLFDKNDRAYVDIVDYEYSGLFDGGTHILHGYSLTDGKPQGKFDLKTVRPKGEWYADEQQALYTSGLMVQTWFNQTEDLIVSLVDPRGKMVWSKTYPKGASTPLSMESFEHPEDRATLLPCPTPDHFAVRMGMKRVEFAVASNGGEWSANEVGRMEFDPAKIRTAAWNRVPLSPAPNLVKSVAFTGIKVPKPKIHDVREFILAGPHRFAYIENPLGIANTLVWADDTGNVVTRVSLDKLKPSAQLATIAWMGNGRVLVIQNNGYMAVPRIAIADFKNGSVTLVKHPAIAPDTISAVAVFPDGKVAVKSGYGQDGLSILDSNFAHAKKVKLAILKGDQLSPDGLAIDSKGRLLATDSSNLRLVVYSEEGKCLKVVNLSHRFEQYASLSDISSDVNGGFIVLNSEYEDMKKHTMFRFDANGKPRGSFRPHFSSGQAIACIEPVQVDNTGRIWTSDGEAIVRVDKSGLATQVLGAAPALGTLSDIEDWKVGPDGTHYVLDERTLCLYAFASDGKLKYQFQPNPAHVNAGEMSTSLYVDTDGNVRISGQQKTVELSPDGKFKRVHNSSEDPALRRNSVPRSDGLGWENGADTSLVLVDRKGRTLKYATFRPDGGLLGQDSGFASAPDGSACTETTPARPGGMTIPIWQPRYVSIFGPHLEPISCFQVPTYWPWHSVQAFDGKTIVFETQDEIFGTDTHGTVLWRAPKTFFAQTGHVQTMVSQDCKLYVCAEPSGVRFYALP